MKAGQADFKQAALSPSSCERLEQGFTHGPNSQNLRHASRSERAVASEYREPASKHTNISIDTCIYTYITRTRISVNDRRQLVTEAIRMRFQPSLPSETRMGTDRSAGGCEQGMGPAMGREGLPGQLRAWTMQSPSAGESNFIQPQLRQTSRQALTYTRWHGQMPFCRNPPSCVSSTQAACEKEPSAVKALRGHSSEDTDLLRGPFPGQMPIYILAHRA